MNAIRLATVVFIVIFLLMPGLTFCAAAIPQVIVFENFNFDGQHKHYFMDDQNLLDNEEGDFWNDRISSIVVIEGTWRFYQHYKGDTALPNAYITLSSGQRIADVQDMGMPNDAISRIDLYPYATNP